MVAIEHNPTQIQNEARPPEQGELLLEGITRKKGKKDALGVFAKLLAGLVSKKTGPKTESALEHTDLLGELTGVNQAGSKGKRASLGFAAGKKAAREDELPFGIQKKGTEKKISEKKHEPWDIKDREENLHVSPEQVFRDQTEDAFGISEGDSSFQEDFARLASVQDGYARQGKETEARLVPYNNKDAAEPSREGETRNAAMQLKPPEEKPLRMENRTETRKNERRRVSLEVEDLRTQAGSAAEIAKVGLKGLEEMRDMVQESTLGPQSSGQSPAKTAAEPGMVPGSEGFEQILARELNGELSADIVKQAAVVLRDGGEGTIKLALKPESLGKVKIHLEMAENKVLGHIVVESEEALRAFEREIKTLEQSFRDSGFADASLSAALDYANGGQQWKEAEENPFYSERLAASGYDATSSSSLAEVSGGYAFAYGFNAVNVLA